VGKGKKARRGEGKERKRGEGKGVGKKGSGKGIHAIPILVCFWHCWLYNWLHSVPSVDLLNVSRQATFPHK